MIIIYVLIACMVLLLLGASVRVITQFERGVVLRFGRVRAAIRGPGLAVIVPIADRLQKVNMQIVTMPVPAQEGITRDNVTVRVDAVVYFRVVDPVKVVVDVQDYASAIGQVAQASLRSIIGKSDLDDLLSNRERLNQGLELMIDSPAVDWGVHIDRVEIKDVALPESMKRSMSRQAEAERERRARVITADGELQASEKLAQAAEAMAVHPAALQLRLLQTVVEVAAEKNSTLVLPFPVELLRFLERATPPEAAAAASPPETATPAPAWTNSPVSDSQQHNAACGQTASPGHRTDVRPAAATPAAVARAGVNT
jgi:regulator of protease activity HflC (stomatin/prohibitin superfamily)